MTIAGDEYTDTKTLKKFYVKLNREPDAYAVEEGLKNEVQKFL